MHRTGAAGVGAVALGAAIAISLASCWAGGGEPFQNPSASDGVPPSPLGEKLVRCMQEAGWEARVDWNGAVVSPEMHTSQVDQWMEAQRICADETKFGDLSQLSTSQIRELYTQELAEYECLLEQSMHPPAPPSEQSYLDSFGTADQYYAIKGTVATPELMQLCPAPTWFLNLEGL